VLLVIGVGVFALFELDRRRTAARPE
jgi:hypothetical protein